MAKRKIITVVEKTGTGYSAYSETDGVFTTGANLAELRQNMVAVYNLQYRELGRSATEADLRIVLDLSQFFEFYNVINAKALAARIGMSQSLLSQYITGLKKPSAKQTSRILDGVRAVGRELATVDFA